MDSPLVAQLFRQLFSHRASQCLARGGRPTLAAARIPHQQSRGKATRLGEGETRRESRWTPRKHAYPQERTQEFERYPMVTADMLRNRRERPRRVKMLLRDFIDGVLSLWAGGFALIGVQTAYITQIMATSRSKSSSSRRATHSNSTP